MHRTGHVGIGLAGAGMVLLLLPVWPGILVAWGVVVTCNLPDIDMKTRWLTHRGITHTVWFAFIIGIGGGLVTVWGVSYGIEAIPQIIHVTEAVPKHAGSTAGVAVGGGLWIGICLHVAGDALTVTGVTPLAPVTNHRVTIGVTTADSWWWNVGLAVVGVTIFAGSIASVIISGV